MKNPSVIVITGASSGLGKGLALAYAAPGRTMLLTGRNEARRKGVLADCEAKGATAIPALVDVSDREAMDRMLTDFDREYPIDLLIANAGIGYGTGKYLMERAEQTHELSMINVIGVSNTVMPIINRMASRGRGQIALMASIAGFVAVTQSPSYAATKAYVKHWGEALHGRLKPFGVEVTTICPGFVQSAMTDANRFKMPFLMKTDRAVDIMVRGMEAGKVRVAFPWQITWPLGIASVVPSFIATRLNSLKRKPKLPPID